MSPIQDQLTGTILAQRYQVGQCLRRTDLQLLYKAHDTSTNSAVHLKLLHPARPADANFREGFRRQFAKISAIAHPNVLVPIDFGFVDDRPFLVTPSFAGVSLHDALQMEGRFPPQRVSELGEQIADALGAGHAAGVVHGALSSHSVMLVGGFSESEQAYILDFGISHFFTADDSGAAMTENGKLIGEPEYMAPEQVRGLPIDAATDIYALGTILYELLSGNVPFPQTVPGAEGVMDVLMRQANDAPPPLPADIPLVDEIGAALFNALRKEPGDRPQTVALFIRRFAEANSGLSSDFSLPPSQEDEAFFEADEPSYRDTVQRITVPDNLAEPGRFQNISEFESDIPRTAGDYQVPDKPAQHGEVDRKKTHDEYVPPIAPASTYDLPPTKPRDFAAPLEPVGDPWNEVEDLEGPLSSFHSSSDSEPVFTTSKATIPSDRAAFDWLQAVKEEEEEKSTGTTWEGIDDSLQALSSIGVEVDEFEDGYSEDNNFEEPTPQPTPSAQKAKKSEKPKRRPKLSAHAPRIRGGHSLPPIRKLLLPLLGVGIVALAVIAVGLLMNRGGTTNTEESPLAVTDAGSMTGEEDVAAGEPTMQDVPAEADPEPIIDVESPLVEDAQPTPTSVEELRLGKVNLEEIIIKSKSGRALAEEYERALRAVANRQSKQVLMEELHSRMTDAVREIRTDLESVVEQYGVVNGFGAILGNGGSTKSALFVAEGIDLDSFVQERNAEDISEEILAAYDAELE